MEFINTVTAPATGGEKHFLPQWKQNIVVGRASSLKRFIYLYHLGTKDAKGELAVLLSLKMTVILK